MENMNTSSLGIGSFLKGFVSMESDASTHASANSSGRKETPSLLAKMTPEEDAQLRTLFASNVEHRQEYSKHIAPDKRAKDKAALTNEKAKKLARSIAAGGSVPALRKLPKQTQNLVEEATKRLTRLKSRMTTLTDPNSRFACAMESEQTRNLAEGIVFGVLAGYAGLTEIKQNKSNNSTDIEMFSAVESIQTAQSATALYPLFTGTSNWINAATAVYHKVCPIVQILTPHTQPSIETKTVMIVRRDEEGKEVSRIPRDQLYDRMTPDEEKAKYFKVLTREVIFSGDELKAKQIKLKETELLDQAGNTAAFKNTAGKYVALGPLEQIKSDWVITDYMVDGSWMGKGLAHKTEAMMVASATVSEHQYGGTAFLEYPDTKDKTKFYHVALTPSSEDDSLHIGIQAVGGIAEIEAIKVRFKLNDVNFRFTDNISIELYTRTSFLETPIDIKKAINHNSTENGVYNSRTDGDYMATILAHNSETVVQQKEAIFAASLDLLLSTTESKYNTAKITPGLDQDDVLWIDTELDLSTRNDVNKVEGLGMRLGQKMDSIVANFNTRAKSSGSSISVLCHTLSMPVIAQATKVVVGAVDTENNGGFLGVPIKSHRIDVMAVGSDVSMGTNAIIVGTDKKDYRADIFTDATKAAKKADQDIEYPFILLPSYQDSNIVTTFGIEVPTTVLRDPDYRAPNGLTTPTTYIQTSFGMQTIREAGGKLTIKGALVSPLL